MDMKEFYIASLSPRQKGPDLRRDYDLDLMHSIAVIQEMSEGT